MLRSYLKIALRNLWRHKEYSLINTISLGLGITCFILILLYVRYELGYDRYHSQADQIYRVELNEWASTPVGVGPFMKSTFPEVREAVRFFRANNKPIIRYADNVFSESGFLFADSSVFNVFDFTLLEGDPATALSEPNSLIISEAMARKYFPDPQAKSGYQHSLGKMVTIEITQGPKEYKVTGVFQNVPQQSHFNFDFLASFNSLDFPEDNLRIQWQISIVYTYLLLQPGTNLSALQENTAARFDQRREAEAGTFRVLLQPLTRIHLYSHAEKELSPNSSITYIYIFSSIALFVLMIACVNFMNLATARSVRRAKEVGIRKVLGAFRRQLIMQFIGEALLITLIATVLAGVAIEILLPLFRSLSA
ncbi:MAG: ABC transporter permease, partial [Calditrichaeota bacterium]|nr:ABC transporter permease [Calditrichota bacterium]